LFARLLALRLLVLLLLVVGGGRRRRLLLRRRLGLLRVLETAYTSLPTHPFSEKQTLSDIMAVPRACYALAGGRLSG
jgi:hypothetical protein